MVDLLVTCIYIVNGSLIIFIKNLERDVFVVILFFWKFFIIKNHLNTCLRDMVFIHSFILNADRTARITEKWLRNILIYMNSEDILNLNQDSLWCWRAEYKTSESECEWSTGHLTHEVLSSAEAKLMLIGVRTGPYWASRIHRELKRDRTGAAEGSLRDLTAIP